MILFGVTSVPKRPNKRNPAIHLNMGTATSSGIAIQDSFGIIVFTNLGAMEVTSTNGVGIAKVI